MPRKSEIETSVARHAVNHALASGVPGKQIAEQFGFTEGQVSRHRTKLRSRADLVAIAKSRAANAAALAAIETARGHLERANPNGKLDVHG